MIAKFHKHAHKGILINELVLEPISEEELEASEYFHAMKQMGAAVRITIESDNKLYVTLSTQLGQRR